MIARKEFESEVACALRIPERTAQSLIGESRLLTRLLPETLAALQAGSISYRHAQKMIDHAASLPDEAIAGFETTLLPYAERLTVAKFDAKARKHRENAHPETITARKTKAVIDRWVSFEPARDGMGYLTAYLPAEQGVAIHAALTEAAMKLQGPAESRTLAQLRADVFADQMLGGDAMTGIVPTVMVTVPVTALSGDATPETGTATTATTTTETAETATETAILDGYGPISLETARQLIANAKTATRLLTEPGTGRVISMTAATFSLCTPRPVHRLLSTTETSVRLNLERATYKLPRRLRRHIQYRDGTCRFPGCGRPARKTDIDHLHEWADGGLSNYDNLFCPCAYHHKMKSITRWRVTHLGEGILRWTSPDGKNYDTHPDNPIRAG
jgi:hypothetical protein